jgi:hypothetical protein
MSDLAAPALTTAGAPAKPRRDLLVRVRRVGYALLGLQLAGFMAWSAILYHRYALTWDFSIYHQAWYLIAHGDLNPYDSVQQFPFWRNHCELIMWPLALLYWVWPHDVMLLWVQDLALVGAELVAFTWICEIAASRGRGRGAAGFAVIGLSLLALDPWMWETVSWDYHSEPLTVLFLVLIAWDTANGRRRAWAWVLPLVICGDVAGTYLVGLGIGMALTSRSARRRGLGMASLGLGVTLLITLIHANLGSGHGFQAYTYLAGSTGSPLTVGALTKGILTHPLLSLRAIAAKRTDIWANLGPLGVLGAGSTMLLPLSIVVLLANNLWPGLLFSAPGFQSLALYVLVPAGTIAMLAWVHRRHRKAAFALGVLILAQALAWTAVWAPRIPGDWLRTPESTAAALAAAQARIPGAAEVVASQGVAGRFSGRKAIVPLMSPGQVPVHGDTWFVIVPTAGIETLSTASSMAFIGELAGPLGATLVTDANGVWAFHWNPPAGTDSVTVPAGLTPLEAWTSPSAASRADLDGPVSGWHVTSTGGPGYVSDGLAWLVPTGTYQAEVTLSTSGPVNVEVWDDTNNTLLARRVVPRTAGVQQVTMPVDASADGDATVYSGWGPFRTASIPPAAGQRLEVRVWSPGGEAVSVYSADLTPGRGLSAPG